MTIDKVPMAMIQFLADRVGFTVSIYITINRAF